MILWKRIEQGTSVAIGLTLAIAVASAQEKEPPSPWKPLKGDLAGAVGTCPPIDGGDSGDVCYLVRCDAKRGPVFVVRDPMIEDSGVKSLQFALRGYRETIAIEKTAKGDGLIALDRHPALLAALRSQTETYMDLATAEAASSYTTQIELTDARRRIDGLLPKCAKK